MGTILHENKAYWTNRAPGYSEVNQLELAGAGRTRWSSELTARIAGHFPGVSPSDLSVLEIGTGPGFFAILLAEAGYRVTAVDLTPSMLAEARRNAGPLANRIDFREMNAEELDLPSGSFDVVLSRNLTWNLPHPEDAYREWHRVPLSRIRRPGWDRQVLSGLDFRVHTDPAIWKTVWSEEEKVNFASTPMFLVQAVKEA